MPHPEFVAGRPIKKPPLQTRYSLSLQSDRISEQEPQVNAEEEPQLQLQDAPVEISDQCCEERSAAHPWRRTAECCSLLFTIGRIVSAELQNTDNFDSDAGM
jgi:hypothetical protein